MSEVSRTREGCIVTTTFSEAYRQTWDGPETVTVEHVTLECPLSLVAMLNRGFPDRGRNWDH